MSLPKLMSIEEVGDYLEVSGDTLARWEREGYGPQSIRVGQKRVYPESSVIQFINDQLTGSKAATPAAIQAAMMEGSAGVKAALKERADAMKALDAADRNGDGNPYAVTMGTVGDTPGSKMERHFNVPPVAFDNRSSAQVAVDDAQNGRVPVPWAK